MSEYAVNLAICDDEPAETTYLASLVHTWAEQHGLALRVSTFESAEQFLFYYDDDKSADILLLDIQMKGLDGVTLARKIREDNDSMQIIFITGYPDFMSDGYDVSALHYLMKPVKEDKLIEILNKAQKNIGQNKKGMLLTIDGETHRIPLREIYYIEAQGHYIIIYTASRSYKTKKNLSDIPPLLGDSFFRSQRSFIVNLQYVRRITRTVIALDNGLEIPLSRNLYEAANQAVIKAFP